MWYIRYSRSTAVVETFSTELVRRQAGHKKWKEREIIKTVGNKYQVIVDNWKKKSAEETYIVELMGTKYKWICTAPATAPALHVQ